MRVMVNHPTEEVLRRWRWTSLLQRLSRSISVGIGLTAVWWEFATRLTDLDALEFVGIPAACAVLLGFYFVPSPAEERLTDLRREPDLRTH